MFPCCLRVPQRRCLTLSLSSSFTPPASASLPNWASVERSARRTKSVAPLHARTFNKALQVFDGAKKMNPVGNLSGWRKKRHFSLLFTRRIQVSAGGAERHKQTKRMCSFIYFPLSCSSLFVFVSQTRRGAQVAERRSMSSSPASCHAPVSSTFICDATAAAVFSLVQAVVCRREKSNRTQ